MNSQKIYTKKGDKGETDVPGAGRVKKTFSLIHALGDIDELNSFLGVTRSKLEAAGEKEDGDSDGEGEDLCFGIVVRVQRDLYRMSADLAKLKSKHGPISEEDVKFLEDSIDSMKIELRGFVPPGGKGELSAWLHVSRAVCRRAERSFIGAVGEKLPVDLQYLNRLSDLLFAMAER